MVRTVLLLSFLFLFSVGSGCRGCGGSGSRPSEEESGGPAGGGDSEPGAAPKAWGTAALLETDDSGGADGPQVVLDADGNAMAIWSQSDGARFNIWANRFVKGTGWGPPEKIETEDAGDALEPRLAADSSGNVLVVWTQGDGVIREDIMSNRYLVGTGWGTAQRIETDDSGDAFLPVIAVAPSGEGIAVWHQQIVGGVGGVDGIWSNRFVPVTGWGVPVRIDVGDGTMGPFNRQEVAIDSGGNAIAVWHQSDGTRDNIWVNRYTAGIGWGTGQKIDSEDLGGASLPEIAMDESGNAVVVWYQTDGTRFNIWANRFVAGADWGTAEKIEADDTRSAIVPDIGMDPAGNTIAVWVTTDGARLDIWANRFVPSTGWGTEELIEAGDGSASFPEVDVDSSGNAVTVWPQVEGTLYRTWANRYAAGSGWGTSERIDSDDRGDVAEIQIDVDPEGNAIAVWQQYDGIRNNIWTNRYE